MTKSLAKNITREVNYLAANTQKWNNNSNGFVFY